MRLQGIEAFVTVVDTGSFSAAAERLGIAKSMVSRRVGELEGRLGAQLLHRTTRRLSLTETGRDFYERATRLLIDLDEAEQSVVNGQSALRGRLRLAAPLSFGVLHLADALDEFALHHPELKLDIHLDDRQINLVEEGFDLALRIGNLQDSSLVARPLAPIDFIMCASPSYLEQHGTPLHPRDLSTHHGLVYGNIPESQQWSLNGPEGQEAVAHPSMRMRANNGDMLLRAAINGLGILITPTFIGYQELARGELVPLLPEWQFRPATLYAIYPSRRHLPLRVRLLIDFLAERFGDTPYWTFYDTQEEESAVVT